MNATKNPAALASATNGPPSPNASGASVSITEASTAPPAKARGRIIALWAGATVLLGAAVVAGRLVFAGASPEQLALPLAFAGGAVLASVIDTLAPEAFGEGGPFVALASAAGFFVAFMLSA